MKKVTKVKKTIKVEKMADVKKTIKVKRTHDLDTILYLCIGEDEGFKKLDSEEISNLTFYAVEIRYPEEYIELTIGEVEALYKTSRKVREFVIKKLKEKGLRLQRLEVI